MKRSSCSKNWAKRLMERRVLLLELSLRTRKTIDSKLSTSSLLALKQKIRSGERIQFYV